MREIERSAMVSAMHRHDLAPPGEAARRGERHHVGLGAGIGEANEIEAEALRHHLGEPHLALLPAPGDRIAVMGTFNSGAPGDHQDGYLAVLDVRGQLDPTFDGDGKVTYATFPSVADVRAGITGAATASGRMIFAGKPFATNPSVGYVGRVYLPGLDGDDFESGDLRVWSIVFGAGGGPSAVDVPVD